MSGGGGGGARGAGVSQRYTLLGTLGKGSFGEVYKAYVSCRWAKVSFHSHDCAD